MKLFVLRLVLSSCLTVKNFIYTAQVDNTVLLNLHFLSVSALCFFNNFTDTQYDIQVDFADLTLFRRSFQFYGQPKVPQSWSNTPPHSNLHSRFCLSL